MKFRYEGEVPNGPFEMYGYTWDRMTVNDVVEPQWIKKLEGNRFFVAVEDESAPAHVEAPRRGRPRKIDVEAESPDDGDQN